jgi:hypothetical protein
MVSDIQPFAAQRFYCTLAFFWLTAGQNHVQPLLCQLPTGFKADAAIAASDDGDFCVAHNFFKVSFQCIDSGWLTEPIAAEMLRAQFFRILSIRPSSIAESQRMRNGRIGAR